MSKKTSPENKTSRLLLPAQTLSGHVSRWKQTGELRFGLRMGLQAFLVLTVVWLFAILAYPLWGTLAKTYVAGHEVSRGTSTEQLSSYIRNAAGNYKLALKYPDGSQKTFSSAEIGVAVDTEESSRLLYERLQKQTYFERLQWWQRTSLPLITKTNPDAFMNFVAKHATQATKAPKNAQLAINDGVVSLSPEEAGSGHQVANAQTSIVNAVSTLDSRPLVLRPNDKLEATITAAGLESVKERLELILTQTVQFRIDTEVVISSRADIGRWIELTPVEIARTIDVTVSSGKILEYMDSISEPYVQPPRSQVVMRGSDGKEIILARGRNGIDVENKEALAADVATKVLETKGVDQELPVKYAAFKTINAQAYDKWLVVDVTNKRMYAYEGSTPVRTFLISAGAPGTPTVLGHYKIYSQIRRQDMRGLNTDGSRYFQPDVEWVNYFYADYAIHGNYWRPTSYFGNINSSHGCVGVVNSDGEWIYNWASIGTPVIVHD